MQKIYRYLKGEKVLLIALAAALLSMLLVRPDAAYAGYVDWDVLMLLFALMAVVAGLKRCGVMDRLSGALIRRAGSARALCMALSMACFFSAMLVTNDVALITFVPLTVSLLADRPEQLIVTVVIETIAANLGSMATPIGNPQNLYLYAHYAMPMGAFVRAVVPLTAVSLVLVLLACLLVKKEALACAAIGGQPEKKLPAAALVLHGVQFAACILSVLGVMPKWVSFLFVLATMLVHDRSLLREVDYALLATFVCFFVFVGNLGRVEAVSALLGGVIAGRELEIGILASQVISNVPAALMLSGFTESAAELMRGVDLGGLGTLVASLASLISFKLYMKAPGAKAGRYLAVFTALNLAFLAVLYALAKLGL
ncbi:MAG: citrate transporter [Oscillospiraceae bacterium]|nr:citrate transporter [Oscillospiraceae bacterium]